jgi:hypothetical protein
LVLVEGLVDGVDDSGESRWRFCVEQLDTEFVDVQEAERFSLTEFLEGAQPMSVVVM